MSNPDINEIGDELLAERRGGPGAELPPDMHPVSKVLIKSIDTLNDWVGRIVCLMVVPIDYRENLKLTDRLGNIQCPI